MIREVHGRSIVGDSGKLCNKATAETPLTCIQDIPNSGIDEQSTCEPNGRMHEPEDDPPDFDEVFPNGMFDEESPVIPDATGPYHYTNKGNDILTDIPDNHISHAISKAKTLERNGATNGKQETPPVNRDRYITLPDPLSNPPKVISLSDGKPSYEELESYSHVSIKIIGDLRDMERNWSPKEKEVKRRLVKVDWSRKDDTIVLECHGLDPSISLESSLEYSCISCICWEKEKHVVTGSDINNFLRSFILSPLDQLAYEFIHDKLMDRRQCGRESFYNQLSQYSNMKSVHTNHSRIYPWDTLIFIVKGIIGSCVSGRLPQKHVSSN